MEKSKDLLSIGETARALGVTRRIILHYEERGLIVPDQRNGDGGNRYYSIDTFTQLRNIRNLQKLGLTLDEIRDYFENASDLMPLIRRLERMRDELNLNIEKLYERARMATEEIREVLLPPQTVYRRVCTRGTVAERTVLLRSTALEAMRAYGTDISRRMYFIEYPLQRPEEAIFCVAIPENSQGACVERLSAVHAVCIYHHGAYQELPAVGRKLLDYAAEHGLTPLGVLRHTYLEGPPQHKDPGKFITQVALPLTHPAP